MSRDFLNATLNQQKTRLGQLVHFIAFQTISLTVQRLLQKFVSGASERYRRTVHELLILQKQCFIRAGPGPLVVIGKRKGSGIAHGILAFYLPGLLSSKAKSVDNSVGACNDILLH